MRYTRFALAKISDDDDDEGKCKAWPQKYRLIGLQNPSANRDGERERSKKSESHVNSKSNQNGLGTLKMARERERGEK